LSVKHVLLLSSGWWLAAELSVGAPEWPSSQHIFGSKPHTIENSLQSAECKVKSFFVDTLFDRLYTDLRCKLYDLSSHCLVGVSTTLILKQSY